MNNILIRNECPDDYKDILLLTYEAFLTLDYPGRRRMDEHYLIYLLQGSPCVISELCFVAELDGEIVGYILYTKSQLTRPNGDIADTITFGPLCVLPKYHRKGIGRALVEHSLGKAKTMGYGAVIITGVPNYYPKLGFERASKYDLILVGENVGDAFMVYELISGYLQGGGVCKFLAPEFTIAENDDEGYEAFHRRFIEENFLFK